MRSSCVLIPCSNQIKYFMVNMQVTYIVKTWRSGKNYHYTEQQSVRSYTIHYHISEISGFPQAWQKSFIGLHNKRHSYWDEFSLSFEFWSKCKFIIVRICSAVLFASKPNRHNGVIVWMNLSRSIWFFGHSNKQWSHSNVHLPAHPLPHVDHPQHRTPHSHSLSQSQQTSLLTLGLEHQYLKCPNRCITLF